MKSNPILPMKYLLLKTVMAQKIAILAMALISLALPVMAEEPPAVQSGQKIAFLGDSITAYGWGIPGGYVRLVVDGLGQMGIKVEPVPAGVGGNTSQDMLARLDRDVLSKHPDWMTLSCGVNDVWHGANGVDLETYKQNITAIVDKATAQGIKVVILTATPIGEDDNGNNQKLVAYNDFLRQFAKERNLPLADLNADFHTALQKFMISSSSRYLTVDGVHMNSEGNVLMAKGCLRAFGLSPQNVDKIEQNWLDQPNTAMVACASFDPRPNIGITLAQSRKISEAAQARMITSVQLSLTLWLQALGEVLQAHAQDTVLDAELIKKETNALLLKKINGVGKSPVPTPGTP